MSFTSVDRTLLQKAFVVAHRSSEDPNMTNEARARFRIVAHLIWKAHGETGTVQTQSVKDLEKALAGSIHSGTANWLRVSYGHDLIIGEDGRECSKCGKGVIELVTDPSNCVTGTAGMAEGREHGS
jgi:hypothetical protein